MRFRVKTITYHDGKKNFLLQRLHWNGYRNCKNIQGGDRIFNSEADAVEVMLKLKAKKFSHKYFW